MAIHGKPRSKAEECIPQLKAFNAGGKAYGNTFNFRGAPIQPRTQRPSLGRLSKQMADRFNDDFVKGFDYVVYSYGTPIAWHMADEDRWVLVEDKFSVSTTSHQSVVGYAVRH